MAEKRTRSISGRLMMMNILVSGIALLLACAGFFTYDQITFRQSLVRTLSAQAQIIASNSVSAILFNDPQAATTTLSALKSFSNISSAGILRSDGKPLAQYSAAGQKPLVTLPQLPKGGGEAHWFGTKHLLLIRQIVSQGKSIGLVYLRADLHEINQRLKRYATITISVLLISLLAALLVSGAFRKSVAQPIVQLANTAQEVSREKDYSVRASTIADNEEVRVLVTSFNQMLQEIQQRDSELQQAHDKLEQRVSDRTRELVSANKELEAFSYSVSHDLRGPLDAINGFAYLMLKQYSANLDPQGRNLIEQIRSGGKRMTELIDDLLNLSRITSSVMHSAKVDLSTIARSIMEELCRTAPERKVQFTTSENEEAFGDPHLLQIVMENLLRNSWKYTSHHQEAHIEFGHTRAEGKTVFFVKDDGSGFDPRWADRLFHPFQRLHSSVEFPGNGIGLATVRRIIQRHGGEVWAQGEIEKGATFYFTLNLPDKNV